MRDHDVQAVDEEYSGGESSSVGKTLKAARESLDLPIEQLAGDLRIEPKYLAALEDDDFDSFSAPVFTKGYLKQYAIRVGLDEKALLTDYYRQVGTQKVPTLRSNTLDPGSDQQQARWLIGGSAVAFVVAAVLIWWMSTPEPEVPVASPPTPDMPEIVPQTVAPVVADVPVATDVAEKALEMVLQPSLAEPDEDPTEALEPTLQVEIIFEEDCWMEVIDARGERLFYGLGSAGARTRFTATPPLSFFLGNASGVELLVDDTQYAIPADNRQGNLARFVILESGD